MRGFPRGEVRDGARGGLEGGVRGGVRDGAEFCSGNELSGEAGRLRSAVEDCGLEAEG